MGKNGPSLTVAEAAMRCSPTGDDQSSSVLHQVLKDRLESGAFPNAFRADAPDGDVQGHWMIPIEDLRAEGFDPSNPKPKVDETEPATAATPRDARCDAGSADAVRLRRRAEVAEIRRKFSELRRRAEVAEAVAEERGRALSDARMVIEALAEQQSRAAVPKRDQAHSSHVQAVSGTPKGKIYRWFFGDD